MTTKLHQRLLETSPAYADWHKHEYHAHYHWALFIFASGVLMWMSFTLARFDIEASFAQVTELSSLPPVPPPPPPSPSSDVTPPSVSITTPISGSTVSGSAVTVSANASDNIGVSGVQFKLDGVNIGTEDILAPYSIAWNTAGVSTGSHTLTAVARDAAGNTTTSSSVTVTIQPPTSTKFSLNDRIQSTSNVQVRSSVAGTSLGTQSTGALGTVASGPTYASFSGTSYWWWNLNFDTGLDGWVVEGSLSPYTPPPPPPPPPPSDTTAPIVSITAPTSGSTVSTSAVTVSANASDNVRVSGVQFKLDGVNIGTEDILAPYSIAWNTISATNGSHTLIAVARDAVGNITTSSGVSVTVSNITTPPPSTTVISNFSVHIRKGAATFTWSTDRPATSKVKYGFTTSYGTQTPLDSSLQTSHTVVVANLTAGNYNAKTISVANNLTGLSNNMTFVVRGKPLKISSVTASPGSVVLNWEAISFPGYAGVAILRSTTGFIDQYDTSFEIARVTGNTYTDENVISGTTYYYSLFVYDDQENYSDPATISFVAPASTTPPPPPPPPPPVSSGGGSSSGGGGGGGGSSSVPSVVPIYTSGLLPSNFNSLSTAQKISILSAKIIELRNLMNALYGAGLPVSTSACTFTRDLSFGSVGEDVRCLQKYLNSQSFTVSSFGLGSLGNESTYFGPATRSAVLKWQQTYGIIPASGYFGPKSKAKYVEIGR